MDLKLELAVRKYVFILKSSYFLYNFNRRKGLCCHFIDLVSIVGVLKYYK